MCGEAEGADFISQEKRSLEGEGETPLQASFILGNGREDGIIFLGNIHP